MDAITYSCIIINNSIGNNFEWILYPQICHISIIGAQGPDWWAKLILLMSVAYFAKEATWSLDKPQLNFNDSLAKLWLTYLMK